jgi:hypothetical protein
MRTRTLALLLAGPALLLAADSSQVQKMDFPAGGTLRVVNSIEMLSVEAWDQPGIEITTIKSLAPGAEAKDRAKAAQEIDSVHITAERRGDELVVSTEAPKHTRAFVEYHIKLPASAKLIARHGVGEVNVDGLTGDIDVTLRRGEIFLHLPEDGQYKTAAQASLGAVNTDEPGKADPIHWRLGHKVLTANTAGQHQLNLKVGYGDIVILKARSPKPPEPKANGL